MSDGDSPKEVFEKFVQFINNNWITRQIKRVFETSIEFKGLLTDFYNACQTGIKMSKEADKDKMKSMKTQLKKSLENIRTRVNLFRNWMDKTSLKENIQNTVTSLSDTLHKMVEFGVTKTNKFTKTTKEWVKEKVGDLKNHFYNLQNKYF
ncbi:hypothetical protein EDI_110720 [Entamoeba dispar SAW760]|uniref:Uncharacterized protein n=1 Tax=Entamoeba dispar (strain ATCC PRA-260 / SAW760) TaxID=370354 RepID=B0EK52_ENTDS|nr:uncharacterized protein EDI_110720 [Entamoeba dispar SAW760]EDR25120.1 hypothetical protein EDI_110720 [Entamoeba dispar SAW760]|eukprot:EDR25120.1 hypothetical protein EDI_110720 [Entamoeba dispar SAW760]